MDRDARKRRGGTWRTEKEKNADIVADGSAHGEVVSGQSTSGFIQMLEESEFSSKALRAGK